MSRKGLLAVVVSLLLVYAGVAPAYPPAAVGTIQAKGRVEVNGVVLPSEGTLYADDRIVIGKDAAVSLLLAGRDVVSRAIHLEIREGRGIEGRRYVDRKSVV